MQRKSCILSEIATSVLNLAARIRSEQSCASGSVVILTSTFRFHATFAP